VGFVGRAGVEIMGSMGILGGVSASAGVDGMDRMDFRDEASWAPFWFGSRFMFFLSPSFAKATEGRPSFAKGYGGQADESGVEGHALCVGPRLRAVF
jgi:hypothetical protein